jgi:Flp pilus assembly pilin Flp
MLDALHLLTVRAAVAVESVRRSEEGQALVEYALILFLVALVSIAILGTLGTTVSSMFNQVADDF